MKPGGTGPVAFATPPGYPAAAVGDGLGVGLGDGVGLGLAVGVGVAVAVAAAVVGCAVGAAVGASVLAVAVVGAAVGEAVARADGAAVALADGAGVAVTITAFTGGVDVGGACVAAATRGTSVGMKASLDFVVPLQPTNSRIATQAMATGDLTAASV